MSNVMYIPQSFMMLDACTLKKTEKKIGAGKNVNVQKNEVYFMERKKLLDHLKLKTEIMKILEQKKHNILAATKRYNVITLQLRHFIIVF